MFTDMMFFITLATVPALTTVLKEEINFCSPNEFSCGDGTCLDYTMFCDGKRDCFNGADEACTIGLNDLSTDTFLNRSRRQILPTCRINQFQCKDGSCINFDGKCDGVVDCPDNSDETHALCKDRRCQSNWFRCTYGACVDGTAPCNGQQECADNSDELLPSCRNETAVVRGEFRCLDGRTIPAYKHCDGVKDCADGSDETLRTCAGKTCPPYLFQCAYGACVDQGANCTGVRECADGSDESEDLCAGTEVPVQPYRPGACVLPEYPENGKYVVNGFPNAKPGMNFEVVSMNYTCSKGYGIVGLTEITCTNGWWSATSHPKCIRFCPLKKHISVVYKCVLSGSSQGFRDCKDFEPKGTNVQPECSKPNYYSQETLLYMTCYEHGEWNYVAKCLPGLVKNGTNVTVLVKDKVEVYVSNFQYAAPTSVRDNTVDYHIEETDWRFGTVSKPLYEGQANVVRPYGEGNENAQALPVSPDTSKILDILQRIPTATTEIITQGVYDRLPLGTTENNNVFTPVRGDPNYTTNINFNINNSTVLLTADQYKDKILFRN